MKNAAAAAAGSASASSVFVVLMMTLALTLNLGVGALGQDTSSPLWPGNWPESVMNELNQLDNTFGPHPPGISDAGLGVIAGTTNPLAIHAGTVALEMGGSAVDAAIAAAIAQVTIAAGSYVSFGGIAMFTYYDAATNQTYSINGGWNSVINETDPLTITSSGKLGREFLTPGFFAALQSAHDQFGKLNWTSLFLPGIYFAQEGYIVDIFMEGIFQQGEEVLASTPEGREIFFNSTGGLYTAGQLFKQPQLAQFLGNVSVYGTEYFYNGSFAAEAVEMLRAYGGKITQEDFTNYQYVIAIQSTPLSTTYNGYQVVTQGAPSLGGVEVIEALNILSNFNISELYFQSSDALFNFLQAARWGRILDGITAVNASYVENVFPGITLTDETRVLPETANLIAQLISTESGRDLVQQTFIKLYDLAYNFTTPVMAHIGTHSDGLAVADQYGNVVSLVHSINCLPLFGTGLIVQGVALNSAAIAQPTMLAQITPGSRVPDPTAPTILMKNGAPVLASATIGAGLHEVQLQNLIYHMEYGITDPDITVALPNFYTPDYNLTLNPFLRLHYPFKQLLINGSFAESVVEGVEDLGQQLEPLQYPGSLLLAEFGLGFWVGVSVGNSTSSTVQRGGVTPFLNGFSEAVQEQNLHSKVEI